MVASLVVFQVKIFPLSRIGFYLFYWSVVTNHGVTHKISREKNYWKFGIISKKLSPYKMAARVINFNKHLRTTYPKLRKILRIESHRKVRFTHVRVPLYHGVLDLIGVTFLTVF